ncbi:MAG: hypothetical protein H6654_02365 [Ardenticatenaceae bacterium]|nr:hypothetical protein [Anaerolineales bacterium]MCB8941028.1 hypothetical protein [Ardenticatenaceae bacterium]MCB8972371.1 hypothetical protein [Ardenticatenaceae bacterium]
MKLFQRATTMLALLLGLFMIHQQINSLTLHHAPAAGSRANRTSYYWVTCPTDRPNVQRLITPLPEARYYYSSTYGWFDTSHFDAGNPAKLIEDVATAVSQNGGTITITQSVRGGLTGYTTTYRISGYLPKEQATAAALGIYMDWSIRFEKWQGGLPRGLFGPLTPFAIEDLPTQYLGFIEDAQQLNRAELFTCYLDDLETADSPPHLWLIEPERNHPLPQIKRLTNETFEPLILSETGWQHVVWPDSLLLHPLPGSSITWMFQSDETWYLNQK